MRSIEELINRQLNRWEMERRQREEEIEKGVVPAVKPIVTVSRQRGSRGAYIAERLAEKLGYQLLHREIIDEICKSSGYRRRVIESLDAKVRSRMELWFEGIFKGMYIDSSDYFKQLYKVIMSVTAHGGVVVVGRAANFMLSREQGFHMRVVAAVPVRVQNLIKYQHLSQEQAEQEIKHFDRERADFVSSNFHMNIDDPGAYDLIINTTFIDIERAVRMAEIGINAKKEMTLQ
ncbi:MAG: cytidylate kinase-like family protein [Candidatus Zixiibacteriota bacterium]|nr:MAG: cytidylate kinase-like family protein [candidate division Zixibacteria bacterium]